MFCVIQEIENKKPNRNGYYKELKAEYLQIIINGKECGHYTYQYCGERFERPIKSSYRISIHNSYRENGKVKKKQYVVCTVQYYDLATDFFNLYDWGDNKIQYIADQLHCSTDTIYQTICSKVDSLQSKVQKEFRETEEYQRHSEHEQIIALYHSNKKNFNSKYNLSGNEYAQIYDVFGKLRNPERLDQIKSEYNYRKEYEEKSHSYYENNYNNYNDYFSGSSGSHFIPRSSEKAALKEIYRVAAKALHPDANPGRDTSEAMKVLNDLKTEWGI